jgi:hypothetical protein
MNPAVKANLSLRATSKVRQSINPLPDIMIALSKSAILILDNNLCRLAADLILQPTGLFIINDLNLTYDKAYAMLVIVKPKNKHMLSIIPNPLSILTSLAIMSGVFVHDMQLDNVTMTSAAVPRAILTESSHNISELFKTEQHAQSEVGSFLESTHNIRSQQPSTQPRNENDKKYIAQKRTIGSTFGNGYYWPSI